MLPTQEPRKGLPAQKAELARAGFFYNPTSSAPDNTTCYQCHAHLDGWEEDDSAIGEHLSLSPSCGWAAIARIEQDIEDGNPVQQDPMGDGPLEARRSTFINWPHENKRGWVCKTQKVGTSASRSRIGADILSIRWLKGGGTIIQLLKATIPPNAATVV
ncbi:MAG: hypothetical protein Q9201_004915 [Fulgogasparrea decipioides]